MARPNWEYVRVDVLLPDHPKLDSLSYAAKWTLLELWCYCGQHRTDGFVRDAKWKMLGPAAARHALVKAGLAERVRGGYQMHDYLDHQRSKAEIDELSAKRSAAAKKSAEARAKARASAEASAEQDAEQNGSKTPAEAEAEAEVLQAGVVNQSSHRNAKPPGQTDIDLIIEEIRTATGATIDANWAAKTLALLTAGRTITDRAAYLRNAIRSEPNPKARFLPTPTPPPPPPPNGTPASSTAVQAIAAQARAAITQTADSRETTNTNGALTQ